eukprot:12682487-Prorocentrum_lima.AAC.1
MGGAPVDCSAYCVEGVADIDQLAGDVRVGGLELDSMTADVPETGCAWVSCIGIVSSIVQLT